MSDTHTHAPTQERAAETGAGDPPLKSQYVNFAFFKVDPAWRRLPEGERARGKKEFISVCESYPGVLQLHSYSTVGIRADSDFMLWRIGYDLDALQQMMGRLFATGLGKYATLSYSYFSMTKRSIYVDKHVHPGQDGSRLKVVPGESKYLFVYPFIKSRPWYSLPMEERQRMMTQHIATGHKFPSVKINTTYSFGLDDQEFVLAFETDEPKDFLDLVQVLRESEASKYTQQDIPSFTCVRRTLAETLDLLGG
jgi:chlorite dismutase